MRTLHGNSYNTCVRCGKRNLFGSPRYLPQFCSEFWRKNNNNKKTLGKFGWAGFWSEMEQRILYLCVQFQWWNSIFCGWKIFYATNDVKNFHNNQCFNVAHKTFRLSHYLFKKKKKNFAIANKEFAKENWINSKTEYFERNSFGFYFSLNVSLSIYKVWV